jgi:hypothetical protein
MFDTDLLNADLIEFDSQKNEKDSVHLTSK